MQSFESHAAARHELLNETNRDEVRRDVLGWLAKTVRAVPKPHPESLLAKSRRWWQHPTAV